MDRFAVVEKQFEYKGHDCICIFTACGYRCGYVSVDDHKDFWEYDIDCYYEEYKRLKDDYSKLQEQFAQYQMASNKEIRAHEEDSEQRTANNIADWLDYRVDCGYGNMVSDIVRSLAEQIRHNYYKKPN